MLTRLTPEQVSNFWDVIKYAIEESLPPITGNHEDRMNRILASIMSGNTQCWASYVKDGEGGKFEGIVTTEIVTDVPSGTKSLLIYTLYGYSLVEKESWKIGFDALRKFALSRNCSAIIGYSKVDHLIKIADRLGADTSYTFISFPLRGN